MKWNEVSIHPTPNSYSESATPTKDNTVVIPVFSSVHWFTIGAEVKIMPKGNPSPKITEAFLEQQKPKYGEPLGPGRTVRFTEAVD